MRCPWYLSTICVCSSDFYEIYGNSFWVFCPQFHLFNNTQCEPFLKSFSHLLSATDTTFAESFVGFTWQNNQPPRRELQLFQLYVSSRIVGILVQWYLHVIEQIPLSGNSIKFTFLDTYVECTYLNNTGIIMYAIAQRLQELQLHITHEAPPS